MTTSVTKQNKAIAVANTPAELLALAVAGNADIDKLEKLMDLSERWNKDQARRAFFDAMADFQEHAPELMKQSDVKYGTTSYKFASLGYIAAALQPSLAAAGLTYRFEPEEVNNGLAVTCIITHRDGHSERTTMSAPFDASGSKNAIQARGSTLTYLQRYSLVGALGLTTANPDDDATGAAEPVAVISKAQAKVLAGLLAKANADVEKMYAAYNCESVETFPKASFDEVCRGLNARIAKAEKAQEELPI